MYIETVHDGNQSNNQTEILFFLSFLSYIPNRSGIGLHWNDVKRQPPRGTPLADIGMPLTQCAEVNRKREREREREREVGFDQSRVHFKKN